ncbi:MAG TPA: hypothetical protein VH442_09915 [Micromonosporaceae bacterium]|jgi:hypothetical protein
MTAMPTPIALVTCAAVPDLEDDDRLLIPPLRALGCDVDVATWDDPAVDWTRYDLAVLRSPWDYPPRRDEFVAWATKVPRLVNAASLVAWNTDKRYLADLFAAGLPVVSTAWVEPDDDWTPPAGGHWVIKPSISVGSKDTGRYDMALADHRAQAVAHVRRLQAERRTGMVQPYLDAVDTYGETGLMYAAGTFSHAIRKGPMLEGPDVGVSGLYKPETITARTASDAELAVAEAVLSALPPSLPPPLYARVDVIPGPDGAPLLVELELTEPSLFLETADGAADRFAAAIVSAATT